MLYLPSAHRKWLRGKATIPVLYPEGNAFPFPSVRTWGAKDICLTLECPESRQDAVSQNVSKKRPDLSLTTRGMQEERAKTWGKGGKAAN